MEEKSKYWSYQNIPLNDNLIIEHTLKYSDIDEIKLLIQKFGIIKCKETWENTLLNDERLKKLNYFLAKFIFKISDNNSIILDLINSKRPNRIDKINAILNR